MLRSWAQRAIGQVDGLSEAEIVSAASRFHSITGVYFLIAEGRVVYVGQAVCVFSRVAQHAKTKGSFDSVSFIECDACDLDVIESYWIHKLQPAWNHCRGNGTFVAPLSHPEIYKMRTEA